jgi:hypothetical protein
MTRSGIHYHSDDKVDSDFFKGRSWLCPYRCVLSFWLYIKLLILFRHWIHRIHRKAREGHCHNFYNKNIQHTGRGTSGLIWSWDSSEYLSKSSPFLFSLILLYEAEKLNGVLQQEVRENHLLGWLGKWLSCYVSNCARLPWIKNGRYANIL